MNESDRRRHLAVDSMTCELDADQTPGLSRRTMLAATCGPLLLGIGTAPSAAASSAVKKLPDGRLALRVARLPEVARVGGAVSVGNAKGVPVAVVRTSAGYRTSSLRCPHQGVTVTRDAALELGPATTGLSTVPSRSNRGTLVVG